MNPFDANDVYELLTDHCVDCGGQFFVRPDDDDTVTCGACAGAGHYTVTTRQHHSGEAEVGCAACAGTGIRAAQKAVA